MKENYSPNRIIAMHETAMWSNLVENAAVNATAPKDVHLKSTGNEKVPESVCLDGWNENKVFHGVKQEVAVINENFKPRNFICRWMVRQFEDTLYLFKNTNGFIVK